MRLPVFVLLATAVTALVIGCKPRTAAADAQRALPAAIETAALERGKAIAGQAFALLSTNLGQALVTGGITNALPYCSEKAYPLTELVAATNQVRLQRLTHKARNPTNKVAGAELEILRQFKMALDRGEKPPPIVRPASADLVVFYAPIVITNPLCLQCHGVPGVDLQPATSALLAQLYPTDEATGFKLGDLRGMWRIELPAPR